MREILAVALATVVGWLASSAIAGSLWISEAGSLTKLTADGRERVIAISGVKALAPTSDGEIWVISTDRLVAVDADDRVRTRFDLLRRGFGKPVVAGADAYDGSVWVATDAPLLLHFARDGSLLFGTTLGVPATVLAPDLDESVWLVAGETLAHVARNGVLLGTTSIDLAADERVTALAVDALRARLWIATDAGVRRGSRDVADPAFATIASGNAQTLALDAITGSIAAIIDASLVVFDANGEDPDRTNSLEGARPLAVSYDAVDGGFLVATTNGLVRVGRDGGVRDWIRAGGLNAIAAVPFRVEPSIALVRPPDGGATTDRHAEIVLRIGALCNGVACDMPASYWHRLRVGGTLDGTALGEGTIDRANGRATFPQQQAMTPGVNQLTAWVADAFDHRAILDRRHWTVVAPVPPAADARTETSVNSGDGDPIPKASNKPPTVALTAPASGQVFSTGTDITQAAAASDPDGTITKVEFYRGSTLVGAATASPYQIVWTSVAAGSYSLTAKAYDNRKATATSAPIAISVVSNQSPSVSITSPPSNSFLVAGSATSITANAADPDGAIAKVEFFDGAASLGMRSLQPYQITWTPTAPGVHTISARATDDKGAASQSAPIDVIVGGPPIVIVTMPAACSTVDGPIDLQLGADAASAAGRIVSVEFFDGLTSVGTAAVAPWRALLVAASVGDHTITAKATDDHGLTTTSRPSVVTVRAPNQPPVVAITSPTEGSRLPFGSAVNLAATASDSDGTITAVEFRNGSAGGSLIGRATTQPYVAVWTNPGIGARTVVAVAYDDRNATTASQPVHFTIDPNVLPTVAVTQPTPNATYTAPANIPITASASDSDGTITKVDFYVGTTLVGTSTSAPYSINWNAAAGNYSITARATDNAGGTATSPAVSITVVNNAPPTIALTAPTGGAQYFAPATITISANASDSDGSIVRVDFYANAALIGFATGAPYRIVWDGGQAGNYLITAIATDDRGATTTASPLPLAINGAPEINLDAALADATIGDDNVLVRGIALAPPNSAVTVNDVVTHIDDFGYFQANDIPLLAGANAVTAVVTTPDGQTRSQSININSSGPGAFVVHAAPTEGLESLEVTFTVENPGNVAFKQIFFDLDGDGFPNLIAMPNQFVDGGLTVTATYPVGTWIAVIKVYDDQDHVIYTTSKAIVVLSPMALQGTLLGIYDGLLARLRAGNIIGALNAFTGSAYDKYNAIFTELGPTLVAAVDQLGTVTEINFADDIAELTIERTTVDGPQRFLMYIIRSEDGIWRIDGM